MIKLIVKVFGILVASATISLWIAQNNIHVQKTLACKLISFLEKEWDASITIDAQKINFFTASFTLKKGSIKPRKHNASWTFDAAKVYISPWQLLVKEKFVLSLTFNNVHLTTGFHDDKPAIVDHIFDIFETKSAQAQVDLQAIKISGMHIDTELIEKRVSALLSGMFEIYKVGETSAWQGSFLLDDGYCKCDDHVVLKAISGKSTFAKIQDQPWNFTFDHSISCPLVISSPSFTFKGTWDQKDQKIILSNQEKLAELIFVPEKEKRTLSVSGLLDLACALNVMQFFQKNRQNQQIGDSTLIKGSCFLNLFLHQKQHNWYTHGDVTIQDLSYKKINLGTCKFSSLIFDEKSLAANIFFRPCAPLQFTGSVQWDRQKEKGTLMLTNVQGVVPFAQQSCPTTAHPWIIYPQDFVLKMMISQKEAIQGVYKLFLTNQASEEIQSFKGNYQIKGETFLLNGVTDQGNYLLEACINPEFYFTRLYYAEKKNPLIDLMSKEKGNKIIEGLVHYSFIQSFFTQQARRMILGRNNIIYLSVDQVQKDQIRGKLRLQEGKFYIPENRNLIEKFSTDFLLEPFIRKITLNDLQLGFCKGSVRCPQVFLMFDEAYALNMMHAPCEINNLFINWKKDFYGFIYGTLTLSKFQSKNLQVMGNMILKKSLLKDNIFSQELNSNLYSSHQIFDGLFEDVDINLKLVTEKPIKVRTPSIETYAHVDVKIDYVHDNKVIQLPRVEGAIKLDGGSLTFFRNKLNIEYGRMQFIANQMNDPLIDLMAKNTINKYSVSLQATGSLQKPNIILESTPELTEEQILGLLLAGSENATLQTDLPGILMQNLSDIILGSKKNYPKAATFFEKIAKPLKYVQITPHFTDQSGRGGIKGVLSVDLNKQIRAKIQKNFTLQEDFAFEVEYFLSDDINLKVVKDQRGELGSEVEVRFKL